MTVRPDRLALDGDDILIDWNDGRRDRIAVQTLRDRCPCATCLAAASETPQSGSDSPPQSAASELPILSLAEAAPLRLVKLEPIGHYAYGLAFSDGHSSGIYTLEHLRQLGHQA